MTESQVAAVFGVPDSTLSSNNVTYYYYGCGRACSAPDVVIFQAGKVIDAVLHVTWRAYSDLEPNFGGLFGQPDRPVEESKLGYSVALASFRSYSNAIAFQQTQAGLDVPVYVASTNVGNNIYHRVLAGLLEERGEAEALMARLIAEGVKDDGGEWHVRPTGLALHFGTYHTEREADSAVRALLVQGIPTYTVPTPGAGAGLAYYVYSGGYEYARDARHMEAKVRSNGREAQLVERVGLEADEALAIAAAAERQERQIEAALIPTPEPTPVEEEPPVVAVEELPPTVQHDPDALADTRRAEEMGAAEMLMGNGTSLGLKFGLIVPGRFHIDGGEGLDSDLSYSVGAFLDIPISGRVMGSLGVDLSGLGVEGASADTRDFLDINLSLKAVIAGKRSRTAIRPGVGVGYGTSDLGDEHFLTGRVALEVIFPSLGRAWLGEVALYAGTGERSDVSVDFGPGMMVRGGLIF